MEKINRRAGIFKNVETIVIMALFVALSIVFGKLLAINVTNNFRRVRASCRRRCGRAFRFDWLSARGIFDQPDYHRGRRRNRYPGGISGKIPAARRRLRNASLPEVPAHRFGGTPHRLRRNQNAWLVLLLRFSAAVHIFRTPRDLRRHGRDRIRNSVHLVYAENHRKIQAAADGCTAPTGGRRLA